MWYADVSLHFSRDRFGRVNTGINFDNYDNIPVEVFGDDCPPHLNTFDECDFADILKGNVEVRYIHKIYAITSSLLYLSAIIII